MNLISLIIYLSCATIPAALAAEAPNPETTVVFTCADLTGLPSGWCVSQVAGKLEDGYNFVQAKAVGDTKDLNYNCIGKLYADNSACCNDKFKPEPKGLTQLGEDCKIKKSNGT
ncbi:hypothetical protein MJO28_003955 [Puccinia striiformis f. sp. tritici]|uniref:Secreted protein n=4 Tax=Puccinia striiformis TaxID=27350 RepID=A0A0L0UVQ2_9BASI|nr:hypothetical protein Pst134EA_007432 [Puccinia striiformis f. sp. tritici]KAI9616913.1 hypothetical protein H4Q26_010549 [Puccinia striiformis f. sp. tritici PST-130]KNE91099.1 hypothetical protein PSTG_15495 [Puccinia striiformis f. sp. tritici PST-78]POW05215.1 hypothetical protein PSTT_09836 [Puccinia striiformis]KAH9460378.1 hypothetical protein Pst134EB_008552 [Puccinia striiformis f. sp. tritici]KAH9470167.1 hypothetical protein Pst134EA_007432 [Puccinia striiformis f. sp. tritici]